MKFWHMMLMAAVVFVVVDYVPQIQAYTGPV